LLTLEKDYDDRKNIENFSSSYLMPMRDRWNFIPVMVQQQAASQESVENMKANRLRPTPDGLGISKNTQQDADTLIGLFAPSRHNILNWERYDVSRLGDSHRELSILLNRRGNSVTTQLYFNGAANFFKELPKVSEMADVVYSKIQKHDVNTKELWT